MLLWNLKSLCGSQVSGTAILELLVVLQNHFGSWYSFAVYWRSSQLKGIRSLGFSAEQNLAHLWNMPTHGFCSNVYKQNSSSPLLTCSWSFFRHHFSFGFQGDSTVLAILMDVAGGAPCGLQDSVAVREQSISHSYSKMPERFQKKGNDNVWLSLLTVLQRRRKVPYCSSSRRKR